MEKERSVDKLSRYIMYIAAAAAIIAVCWYFRSVIVYVIAAAVVALIGRPIMRFFDKIQIKGKSIPRWITAIITLIFILLIIMALVTQIIPVVSSIVENLSAIFQSAEGSSSAIDGLLEKINTWVIATFPSAGTDFTIQAALEDIIKDTFDISSVTSVVGSVASAIGTLGIALFSIIFIGFFFLKDEDLFRKIVASMVPDKHENNVIEAIGDVEYLLSRYFVGIFLEVLGVAICNFIGLAFVAKLGTTAAVGVAFMTGLLNIIPYAGPWIGGALGTVLGLALKYGTSATGDINLLTFTITLIAIFAFTQVIDNYVFQPLIYSTSIKAHPLEIFIVMLMAGHIGGILGMIVAIPAYTVVRVIACRFFYDVKVIRRLIPDSDFQKKE